MPRHPDRSAPRRWVEHRVTAEEAGRTVQEILTGTLQVSRRMIQKLTRSRGIQLNGRPAFLAKKLREGDVVAVRLAFAEESGLEPVEMELDIVYDDADLLVVNKPPFLLVHPTSPEQRNTLAHGLAAHFLERGLRTKVRPVHRLDRDTSGLVLIATSAHTHQLLDRQLRRREMKREYLALVDGVIADEEGVIDAPIGKHKDHPHLRTVRPGGDPAVTRYRVVERYPEATLVQLELETGRTHQLRVHLAHLGHPPLGDRQYGGKGLQLLNRQALHAWRLSFSHPSSGEPMSFEAPLPPDMAEAREQLRAPGRN